MDRKLGTKLVMVLFFGIAFAYIESTVVVYLRAIFYPDGFTFPIADFSQMPGALKFYLTEVGREAATLVVIFTISYLLAGTWRKRLAYFMIIFAVWDIFYYVWLKVLLGWPASLMDWDILFLIPTVWAGPVVAPVITSIVMLVFAAILLGDKPLDIPKVRWAGFLAVIVSIVICFCVAGVKIAEPDYHTLFSWPVFIALHAAVVILFFRSVKNKV